MSRIPRSQARNTNSQLAKGSDGHHLCNRAWSRSMGRRLDVAVGPPVLPTRRSRAGSLIDLGWGRSIRPFDGAHTRAAVHEGVGDRCGLFRRIAEDVNRAP